MTTPIDWQSERILVMDLEATGPTPEDHWPVEIGMVVFHDGQEVEHISERLRPPIPIPDAATAVHGITDADVAQAPTIEDAAPGIVGMLRDHQVIVAYNGYSYDWPMLKARCPGFYEACRGRIFLDPLVLVRMDTVGRFWRNSKRANPERGRHTLENAAAASGIQFDAADLHGAVADCRLAGAILWRWRDRLPRDGREAQRSLVDAARQQDEAFRSYRARNPQP